MESELIKFLIFMMRITMWMLEVRMRRRASSRRRKVCRVEICWWVMTKTMMSSHYPFPIENLLRPISTITITLHLTTQASSKRIRVPLCNHRITTSLKLEIH